MQEIKDMEKEAKRLNDLPSLLDIQTIKSQVAMEESPARHGEVGIATLHSCAQQLAVTSEKFAEWAKVVVLDPGIRRDVLDIARRAKDLANRVANLKSPVDTD